MDPWKSKISLQKYHGFIQNPELHCINTMNPYLNPGFHYINTQILWIHTEILDFIMDPCRNPGFHHIHTMDPNRNPEFSKITEVYRIREIQFKNQKH